MKTCFLAFAAFVASAYLAIGQTGDTTAADRSEVVVVPGLRGVVVEGKSLFLIDGLRAAPMREALGYKLDPAGMVMGADGRRYQIPEGQMLTAEGRYIPLPKGVQGLPSKNEVVNTPATSPAEPAPPKDASAALKSELEKRAGAKNGSFSTLNDQARGSGLTGSVTGTTRTEPGKIINPGYTNNAAPH